MTTTADDAVEIIQQALPDKTHKLVKDACAKVVWRSRTPSHRVREKAVMSESRRVRESVLSTCLTPAIGSDSVKRCALTAFGMATLILLSGLMVVGCQMPEGMPDLLGPRTPAGANRTAELEATNLPGLNAPAQSLDQCRGKNGLLVVFVDTGCPFAEVTVGGVDTARAVLEPRGIPVVLVNLGNSKDEVDEYYLKHAVRAPVFYDVSSDTLKRWEITRVPTLVLLDAADREAYVGFGQWPKAARAVEALLRLPANSINISAENTGFT